MTVASDIRTNLIAVLPQLLIDSTLVDDVFEIVPGRLEGPQTDKDRGSVWIENIEEDPDVKVLENIEAHVRIFKRVVVSRGADLKPYDPAPLEAIGEYVQTSLNTRLQSLGPWQARVTVQEFDLDAQMVEITISAVHGNLAVRTFS